MSHHTGRSRSNRSTSTLSIVVLVAALIIATAGCTKAPEPAAPVAMPTAMAGMSMTGDVDHDFAANMRMHHQLAIDMSKAQLTNGRDPRLLQMANDIIAAQDQEIAVLDQWLAAHKKP